MIFDGSKCNTWREKSRVRVLVAKYFLWRKISKSPSPSWTVISNFYQFQLKVERFDDSAPRECREPRARWLRTVIDECPSVRASCLANTLKRTVHQAFHSYPINFINVEQYDRNLSFRSSFGGRGIPCRTKNARWHDFGARALILNRRGQIDAHTVDERAACTLRNNLNNSYNIGHQPRGGKKIGVARVVLEKYS